jgi:serine/threonine protein kinase
MTPEQIDRVFGCGRLQMVTGKHVEVFREAAVAGTRRRYTKRFLHTLEADFGQWTEREWRILARLIGHGIACVPDVVQYDRGAPGGAQLVQTYDAGVTVDQWATLLPVTRNACTLRHVFEDCAHWWALAHHCLRALQAIHELSVVHLDIKGDNVCIPFGPAGFDPHGPDLHIYPRFADLALIDFAFALVSRESLTTALPIGWQTDYDYQSPRLLHALEAGRRGDLQPTRQLDWRCDMYSLGAMLKRYLPDDEVIAEVGLTGGWTASNVQAAKELILALREVHDSEAAVQHPHARLLQLTATRLEQPEMAASLASGWTLARDANLTPVAASPATPVTRLAPPLRVMVTPRVTTDVWDEPVAVRRRLPRQGAPTALSLSPTSLSPASLSPPSLSPPSPRTRRWRVATAGAVLALGSIAAMAVADPDFDRRLAALGEFGRSMVDRARAAIGPAQSTAESHPATDARDRLASASQAEGAAADPAPSATATGADTPMSPARVEEAAPAGALQPAADGGNAAPGPAGAPDGAAPGTEVRDEPAPSSSVAGARNAKAAPATPLRPATSASPRQPAAAAPTRQAAKPGASPTRSAKLADARARANASPTKPASRTAAAQSPTRVALFDDKASRTGASAALAVSPSTPAAVPGEKVDAPAIPSNPQATGPVVTAPAGPLTASGATQAPSPGAAPRPGAASTSSAGAAAPSGTESRGRSSLLPGFQRDRGSAPIEDRSIQSSRAPVGAPPSALPRASPPASPSASSPAAAPSSAPASPAAASPLASAPASEVRTYASPSPAEPRPSQRELAPRVVPPGTLAERDSAGEDEPPAGDLAARARRALAESLPQAAARAQADVARVLRIAAQASHPAQEGEIVDAVRRGWPAQRIAPTAPGAWPASARQLGEEARRFYVVERNLGQAFELQLQAFGANPGDPDVTGALAFLWLRFSPTEAETARQLSMHTIALRPAHSQAPLADDWSTLAIASALTGREMDATHALYVAVALSRNLDRECRTALGAVERHGEAMLAPVQAMLLRIRQQGRQGASANCAYPAFSRMARGY